VTRRRAVPDESLEEITAEGAFAGRILAIVLVLTGVGFVGATWDELWRRCGTVFGVCVERAAGAMLITVLSLGAIGVGLATLRRVRRRPVDAYGSSRYVWAVGAMFALGLFLVAPRIPAWTCERGRYDPILEECLHPPTTSEATSWLVVKQAVVVVGAVGGVTIAASPRRIRLLAPVAVAAWLGGTGWLVVDAMA
jgi:hypothetical protein